MLNAFPLDRQPLPGCPVVPYVLPYFGMGTVGRFLHQEYKVDVNMYRSPR